MYQLEGISNINNADKNVFSELKKNLLTKAETRKTLRVHKTKKEQDSMGTQRYSIPYSSKTGNTKKLAEKIREVLPEENCDYFGTEGAKALSSDILYIGFWTDIGNADPVTLELLKGLRNKKIFLFGTAGFGGSEAYFQQVLGKVKESVDESNTVMGEFMCQGKMPQSVRDRYVKMKEKPDHAPNLDELIQNFDRALSHPDNEDLDRLEEIIRRDLKK